MIVADSNLKGRQL